jgi:hypothetical protein
MPKYAALIYGAEPTSVPDPAMWADVMKQYNDFGDTAGAAGVISGGEALQPTATATTVHVKGGAKGGEVVTTDGPFAETKEQLGGFYLINARDLNDAIQVASRIPSARLGSIEVRPIMEFHNP